MSINNIHVTLSHDVWEVTMNSDSQGRFDTQEEAYKFAKALAHDQGGAEISVHGADGRIREKNTIDTNDPRDSRG